MKKESLILQSSPGVLRAWIFASRPKTWIAGIAPVAIGGMLAAPLDWILFGWTLAFSLFIQIGTNYANDYYDFLNDVDTDRIGPPRAVSSGWLRPFSMKIAFSFCFVIAFLASLPLVAASGYWAFVFVLSSISFGVLYTGGPKPLGYIGLGELLVLLYFGPIPVIGTYFVQRHDLTWPVCVWSLAPGLLSCAILIANNLRDEHGDRRAGKKTLVVRFGRPFGAWEYTLTILFGCLVPVFLGQYWFLLLIPATFPLIKKAFHAQDLRPLLPLTSLFFLVFTGIALCIK